MYMTDEEICGSYRRADYNKKYHQLKVLSELNGCHPDEIREVLERNGIKPPMSRKKKREENMEENTEGKDIIERKTKEVYVPEEVLDLVKTQIASLETELKFHMGMVDTLGGKIGKLSQFVREAESC